MIDVFNWLQTQALNTRMIMQVHDELVFEVPNHELALVKPMLQQLMVNAASLNVPLEVDIGVGDNWDEAH
jgi:DNA polymerase-1